MKPQRSAQLTFRQTVLALQALAAVFGALVLYGLNRGGWVSAPAGLIWGGGIGLMVALVYAVRVQKKPWGVWLGWFLQIPMLAAAFIVPAIGAIGLMFVVLWVTGLRLGGRIDRERAERLAGNDPHTGAPEETTT